MHQLVYVSTASWAMKDEDLGAILEASRRKNPPLNVTGLLLYIDRGFLQVLEGPEAAVREVFETISRDDRHYGVRVLLQHENAERLFPQWSMGFDRPTPEHSKSAFEITREAIEGATSSEKASLIAILLANFYRVNTGDCAPRS